MARTQHTFHERQEVPIFFIGLLIAAIVLSICKIADEPSLKNIVFGSLWICFGSQIAFFLIYIRIKKPEKLVIDKDGLHNTVRFFFETTTRHVEWSQAKEIYLDWSLDYYGRPPMEYFITIISTEPDKIQHIYLTDRYACRHKIAQIINQFKPDTCCFNSTLSRKNFHKHLRHYIYLALSFIVPPVLLGILFIALGWH